MKRILLTITLFVTLFTFSIAQDTTHVNLPNALIHYEYQQSNYGISLGDESSLEIISQPSWTYVEFNLSPNDWLSYVFITGVTGWINEGLDQIVVGLYNWNYDTNENELWEVFIFTIHVVVPCCSDNQSCNYDPSGCQEENCLNDVFCFIDPCEVTSCEYYPEAECVADYCGGCFANFYIDGDMIDCGIPPADDVFLTLDYPETVNVGTTDHVITLSMENDMVTSGYQSQIIILPADLITISDIIPTDRTNNITFSWFFDSETGNYNIVHFDLGNSIQPGNGPILEIYFDAGLEEGIAEVLFLDFQIGDWSTGDELNAQLPEPALITILPCESIGDVNSDGNLDVLDIVLLVNCIVNNTPEECPCSDANNDTNLNVLDIINIVNMILNTALPDDCGLEPDIGPCDGLCPRYFYNQQTEECEMFYWGCCEGIVPFETLDDCEVTCF